MVYDGKNNDIYIISEGKENNIKAKELIVEKFSYLNEDRSFIVRKMLTEDQVLKREKFPSSIIDTAVDVIVNDKDLNILYQLLIINGVPLYSLIIAPVASCKKKYNEIKKIISSKEIIITCTKDNLIRGLELAKELNKKIVIEGTKITLKEYENILSNYDINTLENVELEIIYQEQNNPINIKELYKTALIVNKMSKEIEKYKLSPLEKVIYAYDMVKNRKYKECNEDKDRSRDLNKIVQNDYRVCVGYSNLFIAILSNLGINAKPLISTKNKHQRTIIYLKDDIYKIDGVFTFDATADSRKSNNYINNYNYFAMLLGQSEKDHPSDNYSITNLCFEELISIYAENEKDVVSRIDEIKEKEYLLKKSFHFIEEEYEGLEEKIRLYTFANSKEISFINEIYNRYKRKYNPAKLSEVDFLNALYNVRRIEYYNGRIEKINEEEILEATRNRFLSQAIMYSETKEELEKFFDILEKDKEHRVELNKEISRNCDITERKNLNIKILKLLRNTKK